MRHLATPLGIDAAWTVGRPGGLADRLRAEAARFGYPLATTVTVTGRAPALLEVYPHPALLRLLDARYRLPYKVANRRKYWPDATPAEHVARSQEPEVLVNRLSRVNVRVGPPDGGRLPGLSPCVSQQ